MKNEPIIDTLSFNDCLELWEQVKALHFDPVFWEAREFEQTDKPEE